MSDATLHKDSDTPTATDAGIKRSDSHTNHGLGDSVGQGVGFSPTDTRTPGAISERTADPELSPRA